MLKYYYYGNNYGITMLKYYYCFNKQALTFLFFGGYYISER